MKPLPFTESLVREHTTEKVYERGVRYAESDAVRSLIRRGDTLSAEVSGSEWQPYPVRIVLRKGGVAEVRCTCPYDWGGWCKHVVAVLLVTLGEPSAVEERPPLDETLAALDREALAALLTGLVEERPELLGEIEGRINPEWQRPPEDEWPPEGW